MTRAGPLAAILAASTILCSACTSDDGESPEPEAASESQSSSPAPPETSSATAEPEDTPAPPEEESDELPAVFEALGCEEAGPSPNEMSVYFCRRGSATAKFWVGAAPGQVVPMVMKSPDYNPNSDGFFSTDEGILYLPGSEFVDASFLLAEPNDPHGAEVIDTDSLQPRSIAHLAPGRWEGPREGEASTGR